MYMVEYHPVLRLVVEHMGVVRVVLPAAVSALLVVQAGRASEVVQVLNLLMVVANLAGMAALPEEVAGVVCPATLPGVVCPAKTVCPATLPGVAALLQGVFRIQCKMPHYFLFRYRNLDSS